MDSHRGALVRFGGSTGVRDGRVEYRVCEGSVLLMAGIDFYATPRGVV